MTTTDITITVIYDEQQTTISVSQHASFAIAVDKAKNVGKLPVPDSRDYMVKFNGRIHKPHLRIINYGVGSGDTISIEVIVKKQ